MAITNPFSLLGVTRFGSQQAFDDEEGFNNPFAGILSSAIALAPIGAGAFVGYKRMSANAPIRGSHFGQRGRLGVIGEGVGANLAKADVIRKQAQQTAAQRFVNDIFEQGKLRELLAKQQDFNAVVQALASTLDDPNVAISSETLKSYREELVRLANEVTDLSDKEKIVSGLIKSLNEGDGLGKTKFTSLLREFRALGPSLEVPSFKTEANSPWNPIPTNLSKGSKAQQAYGEIVKAVGGRQYVDIVSAAHGGGESGLYARIYGVGPGRADRSPLTILPLDLSYQRTGRAAQEELPYRRLRMGEAGTLYRADKYLADATVVDSMLKHGQTLSLENIRAAGGLIDIEKYYLNQFVQSVQQSGRGPRIKNLNAFNARMREVLAPEDRIAFGRSNTPIGGVLQSASRYQHNVLRLVGLEAFSEERARELGYAFAGIPGFEVGTAARRFTTNVEDVLGRRRTSVIGLEETSVLRNIRIGTNVSRADIPIVARAEQVMGRRGMFVGPTAKVGAVGLGAGAAPIMWNQLPGAANKAMFLDVGLDPQYAAALRALNMPVSGQRGQLFEALSAPGGAAYTYGTQRAVTVGTIPILDPTTHRYPMTSPILNRIMGLKRGEFLDVTPEMVSATKGFIGVGPEGSQYLPLDPATKMLRIRAGDISEYRGKRTIHLEYELERELAGGVKVFGTQFRGTFMPQSRKALLANLQAYGVPGNAFGIPLEHLVVGSGEMLRKATGFWQRQLVSGFGLMAEPEKLGGVDFEQFISRIMSQPGTEELARTLSVGKMPTNLGMTTAAIMQALKAADVAPEKAGAVLSSVYSRGFNLPGSWLQGKPEAFDPTEFKNAVISIFGQEKGMQVLDVASRGLAAGAESFTLGEGVGDWRLARGSVEPRLLENLQQRLGQLGMKNADISDFLSNLLEHKMGWGDELKTVRGMMRMVESVQGQRNVAELLEELPGAKKPLRVTLEDIAKAMKPSGPFGTFSEYLKTQEHGVILDLNTHSNARVATAVSEAAKTAFRGQTQVFLPGGETMAGMHGTFIRQQAGQPSVPIGSEYERMMDRFWNDLNVIGESQDMALKSAQRSFTEFTRDTTEMFAGVFTGLTRGKIKGSAFMVGQPLELTFGTAGLSEARRRMVEAAVRRSRGAAVFVSSTGFLSMARDYMGSGNTLNQAGNKVVDSVEDTARMLQTFFTGMEKGMRRGPKGIYTMTARNPVVGLGNIMLTEIFRDIRELGSGDETFKMFARTDAGRQALESFWTVTGQRVQSFGEVARSRNHQAVRGFFNTMARSLNDWVGWQGGGLAFFPNVQLDVHYLPDKDPLRVSFSLGSYMLGDWDSDQYNVFLLDKRARKKLASTLKSGAEMDSYLTADAIYRIRSEIYAEQAKTGLRKHGISGRANTMDAVDRIKQDLLKEADASEMAGRLDVKLNEIRRAVLSGLGGEDPRKIGSALGLLGAVEEHALLKGKKLEVYRPFAQMLESAADVLMTRGDVSALKHVLETEIFPDTKYAGEGLTIRGLTPVPEDRLFGGQLPEFISRGVTGTTVKMNDDIDFILKSVQAARSGHSRYAMGGTAGQMAGVLGLPGLAGQQAFQDLVYGAESLQGGMVGGASPSVEHSMASASRLTKQVVGAAQKLDMRMLGPVAMGFAGSLLLAGVLGDRGYSPTPMVMPGEVVSPRVKEAMQTGTALTPEGQVGPSPEDMTRYQGDIESPMNVPTTYVNRPNSYQIRGQLPNSMGLRESMLYMNTLAGPGGVGSVTINDTRRPITNSYLDRLLGEY